MSWRAVWRQDATIIGVLKAVLKLNLVIVDAKTVLCDLEYVVVKAAFDYRIQDFP
jgi:hypothetical protein